MATLKDIIEYIEFRCSKVEGINAFTFDWYQNINNNPDQQFPLVNLQPPVEREVRSGVRALEFRLYIVDLIEDNQDVLRRTEIWDDLRTKITSLINGIKNQADQTTYFGTRSFMVREGSLKMQPNEGATNNMDVFIAVDFALDLIVDRC
jgi:hypothetical protein